MPTQAGHGGLLTAVHRVFTEGGQANTAIHGELDSSIANNNESLAYAEI
jgi:hypothetical protein